MRHGIQLCIGVDPDGVGTAHAAFAAFADAHGVPAGARRAVSVALDELLANELSHGMAGRPSREVMLGLTVDRACVTVTLSGDGAPFDPFAQAAPDTTLRVEERPVGGLGLHLVRELMDEVRYERRDGRNVVVLTKLLADG